ncbi:hypothetical protein CDEST_01994 [Colletotrichum destructivum]|uniref:Uncharacterized protein n=1 Tax=Colletotrichum destructivum TaxID=34406 RepID=A0AAX4I1X8_9PEZI|nr:hypothetical protein CDEST_01994 [Colletotrichum destructivum]
MRERTIDCPNLRCLCSLPLESLQTPQGNRYNRHLASHNIYFIHLSPDIARYERLHSCSIPKMRFDLRARSSPTAG